ncbi:ATP-binding cassette, subfamily B (MDR/TAP), member 1 [Cryptococcus gattii EJB2]|uniref:ATP-binding cassette, subfamily B (MDR/TAP), member 1 n=1 Tax=Cryptococcus gattii EJB2 TaxID=1296103 RepID=A0ABR5BMU4_9TREE|nr:ATP-binding cassette, subfamily B (MDR/TAP), member 1 [Cryptococcus gattii EJB2]
MPRSPPSSASTRSPPSLDGVELLALTPRQPPTQTDSPFHDRHSVAATPVAGIAEQDEQVAADDYGDRKTVQGYQLANVSPTALDEKRRQPVSFGPMLHEIRPPSQWRRSLYPADAPPIPASTYEQHLDLSPLPTSPAMSDCTIPVPQPIRPRFRRLFVFTTARDYMSLLFPAVVLSILSALIQPYMSIVIGNAFAIFAAYPLNTSLATDADRAALRGGVANTSIQLTVAGVLALLFNYMKGVMWTRYGETVADRLRSKVYLGVQGKPMEWYDMGMGMREEEQGEGKENDAVGAGGLMSKFNRYQFVYFPNHGLLTFTVRRETDDVRMATSHAFGLIVQNTFTFVLCFILAVIKSPSLAFVTLSTIPLVVLTQVVTQILCAPLLATERRVLAEASTNVERATAAISTVKAHNAQAAEEEKFMEAVSKSKGNLIKQGLVWGVSAGLTDFFLLGTFVLGFWYGAKIVREGKATSGAVMTCFWACLFAATYLQQVVPHLTTMTKGKNSIASLLTVIQDDSSSPTNSSIDHSFSKRASGPLALQGVQPRRCHGEFNFNHISFAYPFRPGNPVLRDISLFIPPGETTFIVGGSGSGKSTIAQLLLRLYDPASGEITMDDHSFLFLNTRYTTENIAAVQQGCILFDMSVHDNVAMGLAGAGAETGVNRTPKDVTREQVIEACKMAMIHDFVVSLPEGYDTTLGTGGSSLSGGQRQRLAIARARIRNPTVLILDEATSALDATSRVLVFQNIKAWRNNQTTIVITHDLSQIVSDDFVYVMKNGIVAEQGFRLDLMKQPNGIFTHMAAEQAVNPFPAKGVDSEIEWYNERDTFLNAEEEEYEEVLDTTVRSYTPSFSALGMQRNSAIYLDILDEYSRSQRLSQTDRRQSRISLTSAQKRLSWTPEQLGSRPPSRQMSRPLSRLNVVVDSNPRLSLRAMMGETQRQDGGMLHPGWVEKNSPSRISAIRQRQQRTLSENLEDDLKGCLSSDTNLPHTDVLVEQVAIRPATTPIPGLFSLLKLYFPSLPAKPLLLLGCIGSIGHGATTPIWSFFLSKLMAIVGAGGADTTALTKYGLVVLGLCAAQGLSNCVQEYSLVGLSARWTHMVRGVAMHKLITQDKAFFDLSPNSPSRLVQTLIKDADDARTLMSQVIGKAVTVVIMIGLGLIWAMTVDWRLTLIGLALGPIFAGFMAVNSWFIGNIESACKIAREEVGRVFYESVANVRGIRAMALDGAFEKRFEEDANNAKKTGNRSAWAMAMGGAIAGGLPLFAQALMNFAGSAFMLQGRMNYEQMLQVYNLILFSLTFGSGLLDFIPTMAKARAAARDFNRIYQLSESTTESIGSLRFPINGHVEFSHVDFSYPSRPEVSVLKDASFTFKPGECVAVVGPSGSGKSTIAALLQRLYMPDGGDIRLGDRSLREADVVWLRNHIAVVSQSANLFDATIAENIAYGSPNLPRSEIYRAAEAANIHDFIQSLPQGYETKLGENASLISGGQAQRLQIARALCRTSRILILDECTSALDPDNARAVLDTIVKIKQHHTTIFITHSVEAMQRCDRIICLGEGRVEEEGSFEELVKKGGVFAQLMKTGEWE